MSRSESSVSERLGACSCASLRKCRRRSGILIFTGQTSRQAPHREEAKGNSRAWPMPDEFRRDQRADGAAINPPVSVPANLAINRAGIQARPAANAVQHLAHLGVGQRLGAAIVHHHHVHFLGTVFTRAARPGQERSVGGKLLARPGAAEQSQKNSQVGEPGNKLFDSDQARCAPAERWCTCGCSLRSRP